MLFDFRRFRNARAINFNSCIYPLGFEKHFLLFIVHHCVNKHIICSDSWNVDPTCSQSRRVRCAIEWQREAWATMMVQRDVQSTSSFRKEPWKPKMSSRSSRGSGLRSSLAVSDSSFKNQSLQSVNLARHFSTIKAEKNQKLTIATV